MRQGSLLEYDHGRLAGLIPSIRAAMNRSAGEDDSGRKMLVDRINAVARDAGVKLTLGNAHAISKDTMDKWLSPSDRDHTPGILALAVFCVATRDFGPLRVLLQTVGLDLMTPEDKVHRDYGRACVAERQARKRKKQLEDAI